LSGQPVFGRCGSIDSNATADLGARPWIYKLPYGNACSYVSAKFPSHASFPLYCCSLVLGTAVWREVVEAHKKSHHWGLPPAMAVSVLWVDSLICAQLSLRTEKYVAHSTSNISLSLLLSQFCRPGATGK